MTVTFLFKTKFLQDNEKKQDEMRKNRRWRLKWNKNWCECILMWWSTDKTRINLNHIWVRSEQDVWRVQYFALSHDRALLNQYISHLHQSLNHQIQLRNFNIWASYLVVYDLWFSDQYLICQFFAIITAAHLSSILNISLSITFSRRFAQTICKIWNNWVSASFSLFFSEFRFE